MDKAPTRQLYTVAHAVAGREVVAIAQALVPEMDATVATWLGEDRVTALRHDLETLRARLRGSSDRPIG